MKEKATNGKRLESQNVPLLSIIAFVNEHLRRHRGIKTHKMDLHVIGYGTNCTVVPENVND